MASEAEIGTACPLSDYAKKLDSHVKKRYCDKISCVGIDPALISDKKYDPECLPPVESVDLLSYLVLETSYYTRNQFKAFRSLEAYNQMVSGFINSVQGHIIAEKYVVLGKVRHSQRMNDPCVPLWIITEKDGTVISAHCLGCMAGQGECCSHISSVLFYLEAWNRINGKLACTQVKCAWILPTYVKEVSYAEVKNIDFRSAKKLKQKLDETIDSLPNFTNFTAGTTKPEIPVPSNADLNNLYLKLNSCQTKPVALSLIHPFSESFVSKGRDIPTVTDLFDNKYLDVEYHTLLKSCSDVKLNLTPEQFKLIEEDTRSQAKGAAFFRHRAGRIGASISKAASHSNPAQPSQSLIKTICYPNIFKFTTAATEHGCKHESLAVKAYEEVMKGKHVNYKIEQCGMFINKQYPWLHATPDFLCSCDCCGKGCGEVKCPYCLKDSDFEVYVKKSSACLRMENGELLLKRDHQYYYQVQQQLFTTGYEYCDFVVCSVKEHVELVSERVYPDADHWDSVLPKINHFWRYCVLPEILGRWYTQKRTVSQPPSDPKSVCFCRMDTGESVVTCLNNSCPISNYHLSCLKINTPLPKTWYCPLCQKTSAAKKKSTSKQQEDDILQKALKLDSVCVCKQKPLPTDKLIECHNCICQSGKFFHLPCISYKRMPNNAKTTWECSACKSCNQQNTKGIPKNPSDTDDVIITNISAGNVEKLASIANLTDEHYQLILSPNGWLDCDIIHEVHVFLQKINANIEGLQRPTLGPVRNFARIYGDFVQILHTGNAHWVCVSSVGCPDGIVNLYDSLYHNIIQTEVEEQVVNLVGQENFTGIHIVSVQQQENGSDCGVFAAAFATSLVYGILPQSIQFDIPKMRNHLYQCLRTGKLEMFPIY